MTTTINTTAIAAVNKILNSQASSLDARVQNVNNTVTSQKRIVALNDSYSKRVAAYTKMVLLTVFVLTITVLLKILQSKLPFITEGIMTVVYIAAFSVCIIYAWLVTTDINSREKTDFDKLDLAPPKALTSLSADQQAQVAASTVNSGDLSGLLPGMCIGADCCKDIEGVEWDDTAQQCMIIAKPE
jgi:hypothetical protein